MRRLLTCLVLLVTLIGGADATATSLSLTTSTVAGTVLTHKVNTRIEALALPLEAKATNQHLHHKLRDYLKGSRSTERMLGRAEQYFPLFIEALCAYDVPEQLKYVAVVESMLRSQARSHVGAAGVWQFMPGTARSLGLRVDDQIDERYDVEKASFAAARYLRQLHDEFGDWHLVVAAYNAGPARVAKALRRTGGVASYERLRPYLPRETRNYVASYVAAAYILNYAETHGLTVSPSHSANTKTTTLRLYRRNSLSKLARVTGTTTKELRRLNPSLRNNVVPATQSGYEFHLPTAGRDALVLHLWGRQHIVSTGLLEEYMETTSEAASQGFDATRWLLGTRSLSNGYTQFPAFLMAAGLWSEAWLDERAVFAAL